MNTNSIMVILLCVALLALLTAFAEAKSRSIYFCVVELNTCKTVTLPRDGKCKVFTFHGRKIRLCASSGGGHA